MRVHPTTWTCNAGPVHCTMVTAMACAGPERIARSTWAWRKAATYPRFCSSKRVVSTLPEASTASTNARSTACAKADAVVAAIKVTNAVSAVVQWRLR